MSIRVRQADPLSAEGRALLAQSHAFMAAKYPPEHVFALPAEALAESHVRFFIAEFEGRAVGCAALANKGAYGEVKSVFVAPEGRGKGAGAVLVSALVAEAEAQALPWMRLESGDDLYEAHRLYQRHGFTVCGPFGDYQEGPHSIFMERRMGMPEGGA
jgi:putative acetyltransferase